MAVEAHSTSRRAVLGVLAAAPIAVMPGAATLRPRARNGRWEAALARYQRATVARDTFAREVLAPLDGQATRLFGDNYWRHPEFKIWAEWPALNAAGDRLDELGGAWVDAVDDLIRTAAPDAAALALKIALVIESFEGCVAEEHVMQSLLADAQALSRTVS